MLLEQPAASTSPVHSATLILTAEEASSWIPAASTHTHTHLHTVTVFVSRPEISELHISTPETDEDAAAAAQLPGPPHGFRRWSGFVWSTDSLQEQRWVIPAEAALVMNAANAFFWPQLSCAGNSVSELD